MNTQEYTPNSHKFKKEQQELAEKKRHEKVVAGAVKTRKKSGIKNLAGEIVSGDPNKVKSVMVEDVVIPSIKNLIEDLFVKGIRLFLRGDTGGRSDRGGAQYVSYNKLYDGGRGVRSAQERARTSRISRGYEDIALESRADAEEVLFRMQESLATYGMVSIADLYDLLGQSHEYTDQKYGWTNLDSARVVPVREGYAFEFPRAIPLN